MTQAEARSHYVCLDYEQAHEMVRLIEHRHSDFTDTDTERSLQREMLAKVGRAIFDEHASFKTAMLAPSLPPPREGVADRLRRIARQLKW